MNQLNSQLNKELLAKVLGVNEVIKVSEITADHTIKYGYMEYIMEFDEHRFKTSSINIYELVYKYKRWAHNKNKLVLSGEDRMYKRCVAYVNAGCSADGPYEDRVMVANTEFEAVIKACEWIYKELKKDLI